MENGRPASEGYGEQGKHNLEEFSAGSFQSKEKAKRQGS